MTSLRNRKYRRSFYFFLTSSLILAVLPAVIMIILMPDMVSKYKIELKLGHSRVDDKLLTFYEDVDNDGDKEKIDILNYKGRFASCVCSEEDATVRRQLNLYGHIPEQENINFPIFNDINKDGIKEIFLFTQKEDSLFLNAVDMATLEVILYGRFVSKIGGGQGARDFVLRPIINHDYNGDGIAEMYFLLNGGYALYPRKVMAYDYPNDQFISTINTGSQHYVTAIEDEKQDLYLISTSIGTDNCPVDYPYPYLDSCAWIFGFNDRLELLFDPIPFKGIASSISGPMLINNEYHYYVFNEGGEQRENSFISLNLNGQILRKKKAGNFILSDKIMPIQQGSEWHYLSIGIENSSLKNYEYNGEKMQFETTDFTEKLPAEYIVPVNLEEGVSAHMAFDNKTNKTKLYLDNRTSEVSFHKTLYIKAYNLYVQTKPVEEGTILLVTDKDFLYTYLLSNNAYYSLRCLVFVLIYLANFLFIAFVQYLFQRRARIKAKLQKEIASLQLQLVNAQLDPHFTFNALNTISAKILKGERFEAYDLITSFSNLMRSATLFSEKASWSMEEELNFTRDYLSLMEVRFANRFLFQIEVDDTIDTAKTAIPRLLIQNFAENAVKHAFTHIDYRGQLTISAMPDEQDMHILITDNGIGRKNAEQNSLDSAQKSGKGIKLNGKQIEIYNKLFHTNIQFEIIDIQNDTKALGTQIHIIIPLME